MSNLKSVRRSVHALLLAASLLVANPLPAFATEAHRFEIAASDNSQAIQDFAQQSGVQILASVDELEGKQLRHVSGTLSTDEGLKALLKGTGLRHRYVGERTVALVTDKSDTGQANPKSLWDRFHLAQAPQSASSTSSDSPAADSGKLEEIVVSAQKKGDERLREVPIPISVLNGDTLVETGKVMLRDYVNTVPGVSIRPGSYSTQLLSIRGITTGSSIPTVAIMVDGVPFGSTTNFGGPFIPEIDPGDLERIEVLRGPQGTLYGSNSMGGLLSFITRKPSLDRYGGRLEATTSSVKNGDGLGYGLRGSMNVPLSDEFAIRLSGFTRQDAGYLDNDVLGKEGVNETDVKGGRASALWQISDDTSLTLSALYQTFDSGSTSESYLRPPAVLVQDSGDLKQEFVAGAGRNEATSQAYSATLQTRVGGAELTSVTAYNESKTSAWLDYSSVNGTQANALFGVAGAQINQRTHAKKLVQELRLASTLGQNLDWMIAGYYTGEDIPAFESDILATDAVTAEVAGILSTLHQPTKYREYAAFGNVTYRFTERFDVQVGGRYSDIRQEKNGIFTGGPLAAAASPPSQFDDSVFSYLITPRLRVTNDLMVYLRVASGYRPGSTNGVAQVLGGAPPKYAPDETENYELGMKGSFLDGRLSAEASVYHIDWTKIHINLLASGLGYTSNAGKARSEGVELSLTARPLDSFTLSGWVSYQRAELSEGFPPRCNNGLPIPCSNAYGAAGDRLVNTPRWSSHLSVEQRFPVGAVTAFVGGELTYTGQRLGPFRGYGPTPDFTPLPRTVFPHYTTLDLRAGAFLNDGWTVSAYIKNLDQSKGLLLGGPEAFPANTFQYIAPRTVGVSVSGTF